MSTSDDAPERITPPEPGEAPERPAISAEPVPAPDQPVEAPEAPAHKTDVKGQVEDKGDEQKEPLREAQQQAQAKVEHVGAQVKQRPQPVAIGGAAVVAVLLLFLLLRRRRR